MVKLLALIRWILGEDLGGDWDFNVRFYVGCF